MRAPRKPRRLVAPVSIGSLIMPGARTGSQRIPLQNPGPSLYFPANHPLVKRKTNDQHPTNIDSLAVMGDTPNMTFELESLLSVDDTVMNSDSDGSDSDDDPIEEKGVVAHWMEQYPHTEGPNVHVINNQIRLDEERKSIEITN